MKYNIIIKPPKAPKISLRQVYKFNRIYSDSKAIRVEVFENDNKYYLVFKGVITTYTDYNECFSEALKISETGR